ncbi:FimV/HubP family polar landmark protein [Shewanella sp. 10N.261.52.F9]|uniref:FimV/HubP family polar landmark protein n=1 Tax=Shewanella sp. 10N.261.52.F9 TaxID=3229684 RepID=UPI00354F469B
MNFRTSCLVSLIATAIVAFATPSINSAIAAEPLKITGPDGQVKVSNQAVNQNNTQGVRQYGPTTSADTFWSIAQAVKPDNSVTVYQVMSALFDANPHAFSSKNYNSLERGMILLVPSKELMLQTSQADAKQRAEQNDQKWSPSNEVVKPKPVLTSPTFTPKANNSSTAAQKQTNPLIAELSEEVDMLTRQLEAIQAKNLELTDELARASDEIVVGSSDTAAFQDEISELKEENALLKQALQDAKTETEALKQQLQAQQIQAAEAKEPVAAPTSDLWRTIMDNPLLLTLGAVLPAIVVIGLFWLFIRRKNDANAEQEDKQTANEESETAALTPENTPKTDDVDDLAVHLDSEDEAGNDPLKDIAAAGVLSQDAIATQDNEQDIVVEDTQDEGQSLDDLWAEAMGEQDQAEELEGFNAAAQSSDVDDLDSLLAGFDEPETRAKSDSSVETNTLAEDDDLDALLTGFDEPETRAKSDTSVETNTLAEDDDLDALLAGFDEPEIRAKSDTSVETNTLAEDDDLDALLTGFDEPETRAKSDSSVETNTLAEDDDLGALLTGFDEPETRAKSDTSVETNTLAEDDDLDALLAGFDEPETRVKSDTSVETNTLAEDDDLDALLAGFDEPPMTVESESVVDNDAELQDEDLDALFASFGEQTESESAESKLTDKNDFNHVGSSVPVADIDAQDDSNKVDDIDALLASFDGSDSESVAEQTDVNVNEADELDALLASLTSDETSDEEQKDIDALSDEMAAELELGFEIAAELDDEDEIAQEKLDSDLDSELDALLAEFSAPNDVIETADSRSDGVDNIAHQQSDTLDTVVIEQDVNVTELKDASNGLDFDLSDIPQSAEQTPAEDKQTQVPSQAEGMLEFSLADDDFSVEAKGVDAKSSVNISDDELDAFLDPQVEQTTRVHPSSSEKESGFFDDLKGHKQAGNNSLDWQSETSSAQQDETALDFDSVTDDELLRGLVADGDVDDSSLDLSDDEFSLDDDSKMTVDEALAALDAEEFVEHDPKSPAPVHDLTGFQKDNGFIDIDMLLSEADEDSGETDLYRELDVDMGELNSLMGNSLMVDVDDEENSVNAKLDLARAYIEIDDNDSARALLKEVELDGNDRQQAEAVGLLKELV